MSRPPDTDTEQIRPPALLPGDRVRVVSPSGPVVDEVLEEGLSILESWGLDVVVGDAVFARRKPYDYMAGDDDRRLNAFMDAWTDPDTRAVICSRGGYGAMRLLRRLDLEVLEFAPRILVGFSDITALHLRLAGTGNTTSIHGPVVKSLSEQTEAHQTSANRLREALFAETPAPASFEDLRTVRSGRVRAPVYGGNLSLVVSLLATPCAKCLDGAIVVLEDVGEEDYRLDRLFTALRLAEGVEPAGLVLGEFDGCEGAYVDDGDVAEFVDELGAEFDCPVASGAPVGHGARNHAFPVGVMGELDAERGVLSFDSHAVRRPDSDDD